MPTVHGQQGETHSPSWCVVIVNGELYGPEPAEVEAATEQLYSWNGWRFAMTISVRDPSRWYLMVMLVSTSVTSTMYEVMIPFCPTVAGGCHETKMVLGPRTSTDVLKGGKDGAVGM